MLKKLIEKKSGKTVNVLLLEDDDGDYKAFTRAFKEAGIKNPIFRAYDGMEAFDILRGTNEQEKIKNPYVIISDINMPRMDGITFLQHLRADDELRRAVVFMLTTSKSQADIYLSYKENTAGYICKQTASHDFLTLTQLMNSFWDIVELPE